MDLDLQRGGAPREGNGGLGASRDEMGSLQRLRWRLSSSSNSSEVSNESRRLGRRYLEHQRRLDLQWQINRHYIISIL